MKGFGTETKTKLPRKKKTPKEGGGEDDEDNDEEENEEDMMEMLGFSSFDSTKVPPNIHFFLVN